MTPDQAMWEDTLERAIHDLAVAEKYDDRGSIDFNKEMIDWAKMKIKSYEDYEKNEKRKRQMKGA